MFCLEVIKALNNGTIKPHLGASVSADTNKQALIDKAKSKDKENCDAWSQDDQ